MDGSGPAGTSHAAGAAPAVGPFGPAAGWPKGDSIGAPAHLGEVDTRLANVWARILALPDQAEEQVLGAYVFVAEPENSRNEELEHLLGPRADGRSPGGWRPRPHALLDLSHALEADPERLEHLGCYALALVDKAEQDVLKYRGNCGSRRSFSSSRQTMPSSWSVKRSNKAGGLLGAGNACPGRQTAPLFGRTCGARAPGWHHHDVRGLAQGRGRQGLAS